MARVPKLRNDEALFFEKAPVALLVAQLDNLRIEAVNQKARALLGREHVRKVTSIDKRASEPLNLKDMFAGSDLDRVSTILRSEDSSEESHGFVIRDPSSAIPREIAIVAHRIVSENRVVLVIQELSPRACRPDLVRRVAVRVRALMKRDPAIEPPRCGRPCCGWSARPIRCAGRPTAA